MGTGLSMNRLLTPSRDPPTTSSRARPKGAMLEEMSAEGLCERAGASSSESNWRPRSCPSRSSCIWTSQRQVSMPLADRAWWTSCARKQPQVWPWF